MVPALDIIFSNFNPYKRKWESFLDAVKIIEQEISNGKTEYKYFKEEVLGKHRKWTITDNDSVKLAQDHYVRSIKAYEEDDVFFLNAFQQGLIRAWVTVALKLKEVGITQVQSAKITIDILNLISDKLSQRILDRDMVFNRNTIYKNNKPNVTQKGKTYWKNIILSSFVGLTESQVKKIVSTVEESKDKQHAIYIAISEISSIAKDTFTESMEDDIRAIYKKQWKDKILDEDLLSRIFTLEKSSNPNDQAEYEEEIKKASLSEIEDTKRKFQLAIR